MFLIYTRKRGRAAPPGLRPKEEEEERKKEKNRRRSVDKLNK